VVFRIRDQGGQWIKPTIPKGSLVKCEGYWANGKKSNTRLSFTATSYQLISNHCSYCRNEELSHKALCPFFISEKINCGMKLPNPENPTIPQILFNHYTEEHKSCQPIKCEILREKIRELASHE
jgi:hypothetical protein